MRTPLLVSLAFTFCAGMATAAHAGDLTLEVSVPTDRQGVVLAAVFNNAEGFPRGKPVYTATAQLAQGKAILLFANLPKGDYAATAFLDENSNTFLDSNFFGIPTEPYGFSRNARGLAGPPPFANAVFRVEDGAQKQTFDLK